jgi:hypothetical protein
VPVWGTNSRLLEAPRFAAIGACAAATDQDNRHSMVVVYDTFERGAALDVCDVAAANLPGDARRPIARRLDGDRSHTITWPTS